MAKRHQIVLTNNRDEPVLVAIEPWAMAETIGPGQQIEIELPDQPDADGCSAQVALLQDGSIEIFGGKVRWNAEGRWQIGWQHSATIRLPDRVKHFTDPGEGQSE